MQTTDRIADLQSQLHAEVKKREALEQQITALTRRFEDGIAELTQRFEEHISNEKLHNHWGTCCSNEASMTVYSTSGTMAEVRVPAACTLFRLVNKTVSLSLVVQLPWMQAIQDGVTWRPLSVISEHLIVTTDLQSIVNRMLWAQLTWMRSEQNLSDLWHCECVTHTHCTLSQTWQILPSSHSGKLCIQHVCQPQSTSW